MSPLEVGSPAPDFELRDQHGAEVRLSSYAGRRLVVLMFYPFAFSRVCSGELAAVQASRAELQSDRVQLLAVSCDPVFALRAFAEQANVEAPLLSDFWPHGAVSRAFGVFDEARGCPRRSTFVLDREQVVRWSVHEPGPQARDLEEQIRVLERLDRTG